MTRRGLRAVPSAALLVLAALLPALGAATTARDDSYRDLVRHAETLDGTVIDSRRADRPINPASVVKIATTIWALERLGPGHRFETRVLADGAIDTETGVLDGNLVIEGGGDPDFQRENAFLVAKALRQLGVRTVRGDLLVDARFWIGWEEGSAHRLEDPSARARLMASRLRSALDPRRWDRSTQKAWRAMVARRGISDDTPPRVEVLGSYGAAAPGPSGTTLLVHRSKPLVVVLRRFNCYSNNDIERVAETLGKPDDLARMLTDRWGVPEGEISLETASGLGVNRMTPRLIVRMVRDLAETARRAGLSLEDVLPVAGCDPGTLRMFPHLIEGPHARAVVGKTGSLVYTDRGVSVLAGIAGTADGDVVFVAAMPNAGRKLHWARSREESWLVHLIDSRGGPRPKPCPAPLPMPDDGAEVLINGHPRPPAPPEPPATRPTAAPAPAATK